ncbi:hypothetical protein AKJ56_00710 [candidate division MSBL1 archaeon SCGC-AAA382N08]|uniref:Uncharacterized protein n=1 Tax=candidate division MSBL1 archaeon SCGC-AAA382N08 TaxID=1698285 RepID=A0A133VQB1_9EURY|nr:hypothetical protein AKJ56_00710 [candidate division MSBL1 archaeon SCGC-AAA382N08]
MAIAVQKLAKGTVERMEKAVDKGNDTATFVILIIMALANDFSDWLIIGSIPVLGDIVDVFTGLVLTMFLWNVGGFIKWKVRGIIWICSGLELIPMVDILPTFTISVLWAWYKVRKHAKEGESGLEILSKKGSVDEETAEKFKND